nr:hypothetical protein [Clostridiales bacterium]
MKFFNVNNLAKETLDVFSAFSNVEDLDLAFVEHPESNELVIRSAPTFRAVEFTLFLHNASGFSYTDDDYVYLSFGDSTLTYEDEEF